MRGAAILLSGALFGLGLAVSGMVDPAKVLSFLDVLGDWDPTLILVMGAGLIVTFIGYRLAFASEKPIWDARFHLPAATRVDKRLLFGAALFGLGWGVSGVCPGPALAGLALGSPSALLFVLAMSVGMVGARWALGLPRPGTEPEQARA